MSIDACVASNLHKTYIKTPWSHKQIDELDKAISSFSQAHLSIPYSSCNVTGALTVSNIKRNHPSKLNIQIKLCNYLTPASPTIPIAIPAESPARPHAKPDERCA